MQIPPFCRHRLLALVSSIPWLAPAAVQASALAQTPTSTANPMPVREVTVFKDGHAYILRDQPLAGPQRRQAVLDELPAPVLGTFWPFATGGARIVTAGYRDVR